MTLLKLKPRSTNSIPFGFDTLINDLLKESTVKESAQYHFTPRANILEKEGDYEIELELPGFNKNNIEINIDKDLMTIKGNNKVESDVKDGAPEYHLRQIIVGRFQRTFYLPEDVITDKIKARFEQGILNIQIPKNISQPLKRTIQVV